MRLTVCKNINFWPIRLFEVDFSTINSNLCLGSKPHRPDLFVSINSFVFDMCQSSCSLTDLYNMFFLIQCSYFRSNRLILFGVLFMPGWILCRLSCSFLHVCQQWLPRPTRHGYHAQEQPRWASDLFQSNSIRIVLHAVFATLLTGMGYRPQPDFERTLIRFEQGKPESYNAYTEHLQTYLQSKYRMTLYLQFYSTSLFY